MEDNISKMEHLIYLVREYEKSLQVVVPTITISNAMTDTKDVKEQVLKETQYQKDRIEQHEELARRTLRRVKAFLEIKDL